MRFFFYSHDGMGLGHVRRHIAIATALQETAPEVKVLLATSIDEVGNLGLPPNVDTLKLPGLRKIANSEYSSRRLGIPSGEMRALRAAVLREAVKGFQPDLVLVDKHPFGAGGEMGPALEAAKAAGARLVLGLRDILDEPSAVIAEWAKERIQERLCEAFDQVLVYGSRSIYDAVEQYGLPAALTAQTRYCGYVVGQATNAWCHDGCPHVELVEPRVHPTVLCTVGGGEDGFPVLKAFLRAAVGAEWRALAVSGPLMPKHELKALRQCGAETGVVVQPFVPCLSNAFWAVDAIVCMGGYNTLMETLSKGVPTVCVPRICPRTEQLIRASMFEKLGLLRKLSPEELSPETLARQINDALQVERTELMERTNAHLNFNGAHTAARYLLALLAGQRNNSEHHHDSASILRLPTILASCV